MARAEPLSLKHTTSLLRHPAAPHPRLHNGLCKGGGRKRERVGVVGVLISPTLGRPGPNDSP